MGMSEHPVPRRRVDDLVTKRVHPHPPFTEKSVNTAQDLRAQFRVLILLTIILYVVAGFIMWYVWTQQSQTQNALCAIRVQAQSQVAEGQAYLQTHPHGGYGFSSAQIQSDINQGIGTVAALKSVTTC